MRDRSLATSFHVQTASRFEGPAIKSCGAERKEEKIIKIYTIVGVKMLVICCDGGVVALPVSCLLPELARQIAQGKTTPSEVVNHFGRRIRILNPHCHAFITVSDSYVTDSDAADAQMKREARGKSCLGIPVAVKDMIDVAGTATTGGSKALSCFPRRDAAVVTLLKKAGFIIMGKTNMHELALGITGENPHYGSVPNPFDMQRITGGSSSGSAAAVALGMVPVAFGSDTAGSVRIPASYCGIYGFKPGKGILDMEGCMPLSPTLDHLGIFAASAGGVKMMFEQLTGIICPLLKSKVKVGVPEAFFRHLVTGGTMNKFKMFCRLLEASGNVELETVELPLLDSACEAGRTIVFREAWANYGFLLRKSILLGRDVAACLAMGRDIGMAEYEEALCFRKTLISYLDDAFRNFDFLLMPAVPHSAPLRGTKKITLQGKETQLADPLTALNYPATLAGLPALVVPFFSVGELPVGFQLVAGRNQEVNLLAFADYFDAVR